MKFNKIALAVTFAALCGSAIAKNDPAVYNSETWQGKYPDQYNSWASTAESTEKGDALAENPNLIIMWGGYGFAKDYNKPRGHHYAITDLTRTLRTAGPMTKDAGPMAASCWGCKTPDMIRMYDQVGENAFSEKMWAAWGDEMNSSVGCADCHDAKTGEAKPARPFAMRAFEAAGEKFEDQDADTKAAMTCAQCHVEYYFNGKDHNNVKFPWDNGQDVDSMLAYYDALGFKDWTHNISKAPMLKAQHPEWETWKGTAHAEMGVTCITCHMPKETNAKGQEFSRHNVGNAIDNFDKVCADCHESKGEMEALLKSNKQAVTEAQLATEAVITKAHFDAAEAWKAGATDAEMQGALKLIRHAQFRWDFAIASHGIHAHNPGWSVEELAKAKVDGEKARAELKKILAKHGVNAVTYPDYSTKAKAQALVGLDKAKLDAEKKKFLNDVVQKEWPNKVEF